MLLSDLLESQDTVSREVTAFLTPKEQLPLLELCRASVHSVVRRDFFARTQWSLPPEQWLAEQVLRAFTMKSVVTSVVVYRGEFQQYMLREFPALTSVHLIARHPTLSSDPPSLELAPQHFPVDQVTSLDLSESKMGDMAMLSGFTKLEMLVLPADVPVVNAHVLESLTSLKSVTLTHSRRWPMELSIVEKLPNLREAVLMDTAVNLKQFAELKKLEKLDLTGCTLHNLAALRAVAPTLKSLIAPETRIYPWLIRSEDKAGFFSSLVNLCELQLHDSQLLVDEGLALLTPLVSLKSLDVGHTPFDDLSSLSALTALEKLVVRGKEGVDWSPIASLAKLKELDQLASTVLVDSDLAAARAIASLPNLRTLKSPVALSRKHPLSQVQFLDVTSHFMGDQDRRPKNLKIPLDECCPNVETLHLAGCIDLGGLGLARLPRLRELIMSDLDTAVSSGRRDVHDQFLIDYAPIAVLRDLTHLSLAQACKARSYAFLAQLVNLRVLFMSRQSITDISVAGNMKRMEHLVLSYTPIEDVTALAKLRNLSILSLDGTNVKDALSLRGLPRLRTLLLLPRADCTPLVDDYGVSLPGIKMLLHAGNCLWRDYCDSSETDRRMRAMTRNTMGLQGQEISTTDDEEPQYHKRIKYRF